MRDTTTRSIEKVLASGSDSSIDVREQAVRTLSNMAGKDIVSVLRFMIGWVSSQKIGTISETHRQVVIKAFNTILMEHTVSLPDDLKKSFIDLAFVEMTGTNEIQSGWGQESCRLYVELTCLYPQIGAQKLIDSIKDQLPHFNIINALAEFSDKQPLRFLPYLKESMARLLKTMSLARQDSHRMFLSKAMANFADSVIQIQFKNDDLTPESAKSATITRSDFHDIFYNGIQFMMGDWIRSGDVKVRVHVHSAIGLMFAVCDEENRTVLFPKVLPVIAASMKKERPAEQNLVSKGFAAMLLYVTDNFAYTMSTQMDTVMSILIPNLVQSMTDKDAHSQPIVTNVGNLLLAAENICAFNAEGLIEYLRKTLDAKEKSQVKDPTIRAGCLRVFCHIISRKATECRIAPYVNNIIAAVKLAIWDGDLRVKQNMCSTIISMGASELPFFDAVGATDLLNYVINNAAIPNSAIAEFLKKNHTGVSPQDIRDTCRNTLSIFSGLGGKLDHCLWPFLFEHMSDYVNNPGLVVVFPTIARCLVQLGNRVYETDYYYVDFDAHVNVPKASALASKLLIQSMQFSYYTTEELYSILEAMAMIAPLLDEPILHQGNDECTHVETLWADMVPGLQGILKKDGLTAESWEDYMSRFINKTIGCKGTEDWVKGMVEAAINDLPAYDNHPTFLRSCLLLIGIGVGRTQNREFVGKALSVITDKTNHDDEDHRVGAAKAFGFIATQHPDEVLDKLSLLAKGPEKKGLFGGSKDKGKKGEILEISRNISSLGLCHLARRIQQSIFPSRFDTSVVPLLSQILSEGKSAEVRQAALHAIPLLEVPLKKAASGESYKFRGRDQFIDTIIKVMPVDPVSKVPSTPGLLLHVTLCLKAIASLIRAVPLPLIDNTVQSRITTFILHFVQRQWEGVSQENDEEALQAAVETLENLLLHNDTMLLDEATKPFLSITNSALRESERYRSTTICSRLVKCAADRIVTLLAENKQTSCTATVGAILGRLLPRFMDTTPNTRSAAAEGVEATMDLISLLHPDMIAAAGCNIVDIKETIRGLNDRASVLVKDGTASAEKEATSIIKKLCTQVVSVMVDPKHFVALIETLMIAGLSDPQDDAATCSFIVMHGMIRGLGDKLPENEVKKIFSELVDAVNKIGKRDQSLNGILVSIRNVAKHHCLTCFDIMLKYPAPHSEAVIKAFHSIASDSSLSTIILQHCLDTILNSQLVETVTATDPKQKVTKVMSVSPLSAACAVGWITQMAKGSEAATQIRGSVFCTMALYLSAAQDFGDADNVALVAASMKIFIQCTSPEITVDRCERMGWDNLKTPGRHLFATREITKILCREEFEDTNEMDREVQQNERGGLDFPPSEPTSLAIEIAQFILPYMNKPIASHRRGAIACCTGLIRHSLGEPRLLQSLITGILSRCGSDELAPLRGDTLLGFEELRVHPYEDVQSYISPVLSALLSNFDDPDSRVAENAMVVCYNIMKSLPNKTQIAVSIVNIILKTKVLFDSDSPVLSALSYKIFGYIVDMTNDGLIDMITMTDQIHQHMITVLIHIDDDVPEVRWEAKKAIQSIATFLNGDLKSSEGQAALIDAFGKPHMQQNNKVNIDELMNDFALLWVNYFPGRVNDFLVSLLSFFQKKRSCTVIPAVIASGFFLKHMNPEDMSRAHVSQVCNGLIAHMDSNNPDIKVRASKSLGMMCNL